MRKATGRKNYEPQRPIGFQPVIRDALRLLNLTLTALAPVVIVVATPPAVRAGEPNLEKLEAAYRSEIRSLLKQYCHKCHTDDRAEAEINLAAIATWADVRKHSRTWEKVGEMLESGQMPPEDETQPTAAERTKLRRWVRGYLTLEANAHAGDPGRVVLRRLSNAEYTYTLRDLTEIDSLDPVREFPVDGAAGEGFTNTGSALVMSPALVTKYLDAAKDVAGHAVLLPDRFRFSAHNTRRDWTEERLQRIRDFYRRFTDASGGDKVNLQGIEFDTNQGGRLPVEKYLAATLIERESLASGNKTIEAVARDRGLNAKYLGILWSSLSGSKPSLLLDRLRTRCAPPRRRMPEQLRTKLQVGKRDFGSSRPSGTSERSAGRSGGSNQSARWLFNTKCDSKSQQRPRASLLRFRWSRRTRAMATSTTTWYGNNRGWWRRAGPISCCATSARPPGRRTKRSGSTRRCLENIRTDSL